MIWVMEIDHAAPEHPYLQLADRLRERIRSGEITSLSDLTGATGLAVGTVRRAIDVLADEGLVRTVPGRGTFVVRRAR
jgi:GntR family transcriptional regulator